jgi:hypothetical protein
MQPIAYFPPLEKAFGRMKRILFKPFNFTKWLALAFTAWLANLCEGGNGGTGGGNFNLPSGQGGGGGPDFSSLTERIGRAEIAIIVAVVVVVILLIVVISLVVGWINSRGKFMFLDNVAHDRAEIKKPWRDFRKQGNSLFLWRIVYGLIVGVLILVILAVAALSIYPAFRDSSMLPLAILGGTFAGGLFIVTLIAGGMISMMLVDFVVPVMYKHDLKTNAAWRMFLPVFREHFWKIVLYALFKMLLGIAIFIVLLVVIVMTCCIAGCLLLIPYVNAVLLLPVTVLIRSFSLEFLGQFGREFDVFPPEPPPGAPEPGQPPPAWEMPPYGGPSAGPASPPSPFSPGGGTGPVVQH